MTFGPVRRLTGPDDISPLVKQLPIAVLFVAAAVMSSLVPTLTVSSRPVLIIGVCLTIAATLFALAFSRPTLSRFSVLIPAVDLLAAGMLRYATGESQSIYASLVLLPILWLATIEGRRHVLYAILGGVVAILVPFALGAGTDENPNELLRGMYSLLVFALAAGIVNELASRSRRRLSSARAQAAASAEELSRAAEIQRYLLPQEAAPLPGYETAGACVPSKAVGGDFFDWYEIDGGLGFTLGDVMGKGAGAGMIAATTRAVIRSARNNEDPAVALRLTSDCLTSELSQAASFATLFHARLRAADGRLSFCDAGHGLTLCIRADGSWERLASRELPVGLLPESTWHSFEIRLEPGDMIVSFSDGVLDLYDGTLSAIDELALLAISASSAKDIVETVQVLASGSVNPDDVTILAVRRSAHQTASPNAAHSETLQVGAA
ncbi:serine phosphatase RsbU (regulator of sigma subunit) [Arthrobacter sp. CAN_A212]|uniref:PP2C family protein-serine/threonine phosphatase n=1 Tax=unclassified Arthrobacter TaxID=235627 RepID=UPI0018C8F6EC|nr:SpoIIE family protein phosphatase [Arthrobacter sp. CAN_C5]MBP2218337.1 serine phosphatase RsbU (regulator of sigma subunit) [Arthrobacter sp. CAN_C5]